MPYDVPPLPGETLLTVRNVADRANCSERAIYDAIRNHKIAAVTVAGRLAIAENEAERFIREWPVLPQGAAVARRWREYRQWIAAQRAVAEVA
jgi:hypothetical protein